MVTEKNISADADFSTTRYRVAAISRAIDVLQSFSRQTPRRSARDIADQVGISEPQANRILVTLERYGLTRSGEGSWQLGIAWLHMADIQQRQFDIRQVSLPVMRRIRDTLDETVILAVRAGDHRVNIDYVESTQLVRRVRQPGLEVGLHIGAAGRVLMSEFSKQELDRYISDNSFTDHTSKRPMSKQAFLKDLRRVRERGYVLTIAEITQDTAAIASPIRNYRGDVVAALTVSFPHDRLTNSLQNDCIKQVTGGAMELSALLGYIEGRRG